MNILTELHIKELNISTANLSTKVTVAIGLNVGGDWTAKSCYIKGLHELTNEVLTDLVNNNPKLLHYREALKIFGVLEGKKYVMDLELFNER